MSKPRPLPHNLDAERACLGAVLLRQEVLSDVIAEAPARDFYVPAHQDVLRSMQRLAAAGKPIDLLMLEMDLDAHDRLARVGGVAALADLAGAVPTAQSALYYARAVRETAQMRAAIHAAADLTAEAYAGEQGAEQVLQAGIDALQGAFRGSGQVRTIAEVVGGLRDQIEQRTAAAWGEAEGDDDPPPLGIPSGIEQLDEQLTFGGIPVGHPSLLGADSSTGKSALADRWIRTCAERIGPVLDCTLEDSAESRVLRHVAGSTMTSNTNLQRYVVQRREDWDAVAEDLATLERLPIHYLEEIPEDVNALCHQAQRVIQREGCRLWVVDYAQLIPSGLQRSGPYEDSSAIMKAINATARKLRDCATLIVSQFSQRKDSEIAPALRDFFGAAEVSQKAHTAMALWRPRRCKDKSSGKPYPAIWCDLLKQKNGPTGGFPIGWHQKSAAFFDCADPRFMALLDREGWDADVRHRLVELYTSAVGL